jgi:two-component system cell cycle response regulator
LVGRCPPLEASLRGSDVIARLGGDEFCALLGGAEAEMASNAVARIEAALAERNANTEEPFELSLSVGLADTAPAR